MRPRFRIGFVTGRGLKKDFKLARAVVPQPWCARIRVLSSTGCVLCWVSPVSFVVLSHAFLGEFLCCCCPLFFNAGWVPRVSALKQLDRLLCTTDDLRCALFFDSRSPGWCVGCLRVTSTRLQRCKDALSGQPRMQVGESGGLAFELYLRYRLSSNEMGGTILAFQPPHYTRQQTCQIGYLQISTPLHPPSPHLIRSASCNHSIIPPAGCGPQCHGVRFRLLETERFGGKTIDPGNP